ncbi:zinc-binding dehydrogenase [Streptomyces sp. NPDC002215]|uniref:zinc-binding dehydrogenase n=1 Tax=Streptomyces sp. NPDC002215 TaxID=3154412 RepID=UPI00332F2D33
MELADAGALLADGRTATLLRDTAGETAGRRVLVLAAGGGVGSLLVQSAVRDGAEVVGAAGGGPKKALIGSLGATYVDYRRAGWEQRVGPVDVLFDGVGGNAGTAATTLVRPGGRVLRHGFASGADAETSAERLEALGVRVSELAGAPAPEQNLVLIRRALDLAVAGAWRPLVGQVVPLERGSEAHARIESRLRFGKTLLDAR